ncbi:MAG: adenylate kinase [Armatimonadetes bacterium]|nr:adenylate kinase [Armatimonadota bacterium]
MRLVFIGPPGVGKGTQAKRLQEITGSNVFSTGDILRDAMANGTPLGLEAKRFVESGELVPDEVVNGLIRETLAPLESGFILDGYPRTVAQGRFLESLLTELERPLDAVIEFVLDEETLVRRLSGRRTCSQCGAIFHIEASPSAKGDLCDKCGGSLTIRKDDEPETIRKRLIVYRDQTAPLVGFYKERGAHRAVSAEASPDQVFASLKETLGL